MDNYQNNEYTESYNSALNVDEDKSVELNSDSVSYVKINKHPVLTFQLVIVMSVTLFMFIIKFCSADLFSVIINRYEAEISKSIIYNGDFDSLDFSGVFSTDDEV